MAQPGLIAIHPGAGGGRGASRWEQLAPQVLVATGATCFLAPSAEAMQEAWRQAAEAGAPVLAAAGGDGSLNLLVNTLMDPSTDQARWACAFGALGLGSSNDAHKPHPPKGPAWVGKHPVALNLDAAQSVDLLRADWLDAQGQRGTRYALLNASVGVLAEGNAYYSSAWPEGGQGQSLSAMAKGLHPELGMAVAGLWALGAHRPLALQVVADGQAWHEGPLHNLNLLLSQHVSGSFRYDLPPLPSPGLAWAALAYGGNLLGLLRLAAGLAQGRFSGGGGAQARQVRQLAVCSAAPFWLELDGELVWVREAQLRVLPQALRRCAPGLSAWSPLPQGKLG